MKKQPNKTTQLEVINTIEVSPYDYANSKYESPNSSLRDAPEEWERFWKKCLADKNLENLRAIKTGSYLVDINSIKKSELAEILKSELKEIELDNYEEEVGGIYGGIVIKINHESRIEPTCCGDLGNISEWEDIFVTSNKDWKQLWIGHPWIFYRKKDGNIEFSDYYEGNIDEVKDIRLVLSIPISELKNKLEVIQKEQIEFEERINVILKEMGLENTNRIAKLMTGNE